MPELGRVSAINVNKFTAFNDAVLSPNEDVNQMWFK